MATSNLFRAVIAIIIIVVVIVLVVAYYVAQYKNLDVDVEERQSTVSRISTDEVDLRIVLKFKNKGSVDLDVPPTTFDTWVDGEYAGKGTSPAVTVPGGGMATVVAIVNIDRNDAPDAFLALVDAGDDTVRVKGKAHVDLWFLTFDYPFERTFKMGL